MARKWIYRGLQKFVLCIILILILCLVIHYKIANIKTSGDISIYMESGRDYVIEDLNNIEDNFPLVEKSKSDNNPNTSPRRNKVNIFKGTEYDSYDTESEKTRLKTLKGELPIYVHPASADDMISSYVRDFGTWEEDLLNQTAVMVLKYPGLTFIDLGCNIGVYTLYMADIGANVIAVDPVIDNLKLLSLSLKSGHRFHGNVTLIWNAITDEYKKVELNVPNGNIGGAHIIDTEQDKLSKSLNHISTILIDDLAPLIKDRNVAFKIDIEGQEGNALQGARTFFQTFDVKFILMEFVHHRRSHSGQVIVDFLVRNGFMPYATIHQRNFLDIDKFYMWPENVFWIKR